MLTDFQARERAGGISLSFEPVVPKLGLGQAIRDEDYVSFYWVFRPELDERYVSNPGVTAQKTGNYDWAGATTRGYLALFPVNGNHDWGPWLENRLDFVGTAQYFWNIETGQPAGYVSAALQYNLSKCELPEKTDPGVYPECKFSGSSSISLEYDYGIDRDSLVMLRQLLIELTFAL